MSSHPSNKVIIDTANQAFDEAFRDVAENSGDPSLLNILGYYDVSYRETAIYANREIGLAPHSPYKNLESDEKYPLRMWCRSIRIIRREEIPIPPSQWDEFMTLIAAKASTILNTLLNSKFTSTSNYVIQSDGHIVNEGIIIIGKDGEDGEWKREPAILPERF